MPKRSVWAAMPAIGLLVLATVAQLFALNANASADFSKLGGRAIDTKDGQPISGMTIQVFIAAPGQEQVPKPIAETVTEPNGRFQMSVPKTAPFALVKIRVFPPIGIPCGGVSLVGVIGAATSYAARREVPTFAPPSFEPHFSGEPHPTVNKHPLNVNVEYSTFEMTDVVNTDKWCTGAIGLFTTREEE